MGNTFITARITEIKAVMFQKSSQFQVEGKMLPMVPKPPRLCAPCGVKMSLSCLT